MLPLPAGEAGVLLYLGNISKIYCEMNNKKNFKIFLEVFFF